MTSSDGQKLFFYLLYNYNHILTSIIKVLVYYERLFCTLIQPLVLKFRYIRNPQYWWRHMHKIILSWTWVVLLIGGGSFCSEVEVWSLLIFSLDRIHFLDFLAGRVEAVVRHVAGIEPETSGGHPSRVRQDFGPQVGSSRSQERRTQSGLGSSILNLRLKFLIVARAFKTSSSDRVIYRKLCSPLLMPLV